ncbi:hypothetical protein FRC14_002575 [Serendipita sp. 396]|nr:hypothetical protein FRC14_002575 [Serendipita sp. 396]KAG8828845.1 hypothetical protein FRC19_000233 [Serendipita sp. 401]
MVHQLVAAFQIFQRRAGEGAIVASVLRPSVASREALQAFHDEDYLDYVLDPLPPNKRPNHDTGKEFGIEDDCPWFRGLNVYVPAVAGATLAAAETLISGRADIAIAWDGGRHHAQKSSASGFCYVADIPLAIMLLKKAKSPKRPRIMYLDLDLHWSDGVSKPLSNQHPPSRILTLSVHHTAPGFFPADQLAHLTSEDTTDPYTLSIPLARGASASTFATIWPSIEGIRGAFMPDFVVVQCGVDGLAGDPMATWNWSLAVEEEGSLGWCIQKVLSWNHRTLLLGGGGYHSANAARAWTYLTLLAAGKQPETEMPIPEHGSWPRYAPSFTMEIEKGSMPDENQQDYLQMVNERFAIIGRRIRVDSTNDI